jgi:hypothetical protein
MAELFQTSKQNVSLHIKNIFEERELQENSVVKEYLTTAPEISNAAPIEQLENSINTLRVMRKPKKT